MRSSERSTARCSAGRSASIGAEHAVDRAAQRQRLGDRGVAGLPGGAVAEALPLGVAVARRPGRRRRARRPATRAPRARAPGARPRGGPRRPGASARAPPRRRQHLVARRRRAPARSRASPRRASARAPAAAAAAPAARRRARPASAPARRARSGGGRPACARAGTRPAAAQARSDDELTPEQPRGRRDGQQARAPCAAPRVGAGGARVQSRRCPQWPSQAPPRGGSPRAPRSDARVSSPVSPALACADSWGRVSRGCNLDYRLGASRT